MSTQRPGPAGERAFWGRRGEKKFLGSHFFSTSHQSYAENVKYYLAVRLLRRREPCELLDVPQVWSSVRLSPATRET
jgi:hypothetical protein